MAFGSGNMVTLGSLEKRQHLWRNHKEGEVIGEEAV
jgi:hypothetical protein